MSWIDRVFNLEEINGGNRCPTYLYRWTLFQPRRPRWLWKGFGIYVHKFVGDDWSLDLHDHPKRFVSVGLRGSYRETWMAPCWALGSYHGEWERTTRPRSRVYRAPWIRTFPASHVHRIELLDDRRPCWTLVIVLRHVREWGFWHDGQFIPWKEYVRGKSSWIADKMRACL